MSLMSFCRRDERVPLAALPGGRTPEVRRLYVADSWKCQMTSDGHRPAACAADGR